MKISQLGHLTNQERKGEGRMRGWRIPWLVVIIIWMVAGLYWPHLPHYIRDPIWPGTELWRRHWAIVFPGLIATLGVMITGLVQETFVVVSPNHRLWPFLGWIGAGLGMAVLIRSWLFFSDHLASGHPEPLDFHSIALVLALVVVYWAMELIRDPSTNAGPILALAASGLVFVDYVWHGLDSLSLTVLALLATALVRNRILSQHDP